MDAAAILSNFQRACLAVSDINEHVGTLAKYAGQCSEVCEFGVRGGVSTWGLLAGLLSRAETLGPAACPVLSLSGYDLDEAPEATYGSHASDGSGRIKLTFHRGSVLDAPPVSCDLLFIDTFHVYGQLKRELARHAAGVRRYIAMHDTAVDGERGEAVRAGWNTPDTLSRLERETGIPAPEMLQGLQKALDEFLAEHPEWHVLEKWNNNNGLTVLGRRMWVTTSGSKEA